MSKYDDNTRAAVMAALLGGQSISSVASEYKIPRGTVATWSSKLPKNQTVSNTKKEEIGDLLLEYLGANLKALRIQVEQFASVEWLNKQNAADVAVLHGVMTDKAVRLLEAFSNDSGTDTED